jgi:nucleotide-binding universal stress UspA family protein
MFNHVLVPTDGSPGSVRAASIVADLAKRNPDAKVTVICAIALTDPDKTDLDAQVVEQQNNAVKHAAEKALSLSASVFKVAEVAFEAKIVIGDPVSSAIVAEAGKGSYDVIAMASRGLSKKQNDRHYLGSVTDHVLRQVDIPVLVLPIRDEI